MDKTDWQFIILHTENLISLLFLFVIALKGDKKCGRKEN